MKIETKFNINQIVFILNNNRIESVRVDQIETFTNAHNSLSINYLLVEKDSRNRAEIGTYLEDDIFETKEDLIKSL